MRFEGTNNSKLTRELTGELNRGWVEMPLYLLTSLDVAAATGVQLPCAEMLVMADNCLGDMPDGSVIRWQELVGRARIGYYGCSAKPASLGVLFTAITNGAGLDSREKLFRSDG